MVNDGSNYSLKMARAKGESGLVVLFGPHGRKKVERKEKWTDLREVLIIFLNYMDVVYEIVRETGARHVHSM